MDPVIDFGSAVGLVARLWRAMDLGRHDEVLGLLTEGCRWQRDGGWQEGLAAIGASLDRRSGGRTVRHLLSNFSVERGAARAELSCYLLAYDASGERAGSPLPLGAPLAMADLTSTVVAVGKELQVSEIGMDVVFMRSAA